MKTQPLIASILIVVFILLVSGCVSSRYAIRATHLSEIPEDYVDITEEQIVSFPHLLQALSSNSSIITPKTEFDQVRTFLMNDTEHAIRYLDEYYVITFVFAD